ncbi:MAG: response regulator [Gemmatimonadales bacterium]
MTLSALLVDDSPDFLRSAVRTVERHPDVAVVGTACSGCEGLAQAERLHPQVVFLDVAMPDLNGLDATRSLKRWPAPPYVVILTLYDIPEYRDAAALAGADAFVPKWELDAQLPGLLERVRRRYGDPHPVRHR